MIQISANDAFDLADQFRTTAQTVGNWLFAKWDNLNAIDREKLRALDLTLLSAASDLTTHAVGVVLDDAQTDLDELKSAAKKSQDAVGTINDIKKVISIAAALISLAAAIPTGNVGTIVASIKGVADAIGV